MKFMRRQGRWLAWFVGSLLLLPVISASGIPKEKRPRLDAKTAALGAGFRITTVHPMRGNFAEYEVLEIVNTSSAIGERIPQEEMERYTENLVQSFQKAGIFREVRRVDRLTFPPPLSSAVLMAPDGAQPSDANTEHRDPRGAAIPPLPFRAVGFTSPGDETESGATDFLAPFRWPFLFAPADDIVHPSWRPVPLDDSTLPPDQASAAGSDSGTTRTMLITNEVIYYKQGDRLSRAMGLGFGYHRFVVRFHIYDKERGVELAMGNISGEVNTSFYSLPLLAGDDQGRASVAAALVNRVEVRRAKAEQ